MDRSLSELRLRAEAILQLSDSELREEFAQIAREKSPSAAFNLARALASGRGFAGMEGIALAKATRWLSAIRRDYGSAEFDKTIS